MNGAGTDPLGVPDIVAFGGMARCPACGAAVGHVTATGGFQVSVATVCPCGLVLEATTE